MIPIGLDLDNIKINITTDLFSKVIKGSQDKWKINNHFIKMDDIGYEGLSETLASELLKKIKYH